MDKDLGLLFAALMSAVGFAILSSYNYLLFHTIIELFTVAVAGGIFIFAWNSRKYTKNNYLVFIGIAFLFTAIIDLMHTLAYKGIGIFDGGANLATQLWIAARYLQAVSFLIAYFTIQRKAAWGRILLSYAAVTFLVFSSIFAFPIFPTAFVEGAGLTSFKIISEYIISAMLLVSMLLLSRIRQLFSKNVYYLLFFSILLTILAELSFTQYASVFDQANMLGHLFKLTAFILVYMAILRTGFLKPNEILFKNLKDKENALVESETRLKNLYSSMNEGLAIHSIVYKGGKPVDYTLQEVNPAYEKITGLSRKSIVGKNATEAYNAKKPPYLDIYSKVASTGKPVSFEAFFQPMGKHFSISVFSPEKGSFVTLFSDITSIRQDQKKIEELNKKLTSSLAQVGEANKSLNASKAAALNMMEDAIRARDELAVSEAKQKSLKQKAREERDILNIIMDNTDTLLAYLDNDFNFIKVNSRYAKISGYTSADLIGKNHFKFFPDDENKKIFEKVRDTGKQYTVYSKPFRFKNQPERGTTYWDWSLIPVKDASGTVTGLVLSSLDVTEQVRAKERIKLSEQKYRSHMINTPVAVIEYDMLGRITSWNNAAEKIFGYSAQEVLGNPSLISPSQSAKQKGKEWKQLVQGKKRYMPKRKHTTKSGKQIYCEWYNSVLTDAKGNLLGIASIGQDITHDIMAEEKLKRSETKYRKLFEASRDGVLLLDKDGKILDANPPLLKLVGIKKDLQGNYFWEIPSFKTIAKNRSAFRKLSRKRFLRLDNIIFKSPDGSEMVIEVTCNSYTTDSTKNIQCVFRDRTARQQIEARIVKSLQEKETLLKETHHRVKNNLQIISSLLQLQSRHVADKAAKKYLKSTRDRIRAIALVHETLYRSEYLSDVNLGNYLTTIADDLFRSYGIRDIKLKTDIQQVPLSSKKAVPCGMIVNELISNSLKYAFDGRKKGKIDIIVKKKGKSVTLTVADDGVGIGKDFDIHKTDSLGLQLVASLVEQLDGKLKIQDDKGTRFILNFPLEDN